MISCITVSRANSCMVLTRSMATTNQETGSPPNALERQVQTPTVVVEWLTQWNHELERQLKQRNDQELDDQNNRQGRDECDENPPQMNDH